MTKIAKIIDSIKLLSVGEFIEFNQALKESFNITDSMLNMGSGSGASAAPIEETPVVDVNKKVSIILKELGTTKPLQYIKAATDKALLGLDMNTGKKQVEEATAGNMPVIKTDISLKDAQDLIAKIKESLPELVLEIK